MSAGINAGGRQDCLPHEHNELPRTLGLADALSIVVGIVIGGGIFLVPNLVARTLSSTTSILAVWVVAGIASFFGALACAELGTALPSTGGQYVYLHRIYGPLTAFVYGWTMFLVCRTAQAAWLAVTFTLYVSYFVPLSPLTAKLMGVGVILILGAINYRGVSIGALVQKSFTSAKVFGLLIIIGSAFLLHSSAPPTAAAVSVPFSLSSFGIALIACVLSYDGWVQVADVAGEMKNPQRNVLLALTFGVGICMGIYLLANVAYLHVLGVGGVAASDHVGASAAERVMGPAGGTLVALIILVSIIGALNGTFMTSPRVYFAQAHSGLFFQKFAEVHPQFRTPTFAILAQGGWAIVLLLTGSYETLMDYAMFAFWFFYGLMVLGVMVLRRTQPELARPYKMWGYPVTPLLFLLTTIFFLGNTVVNRPGPSIAALGLIAVGVPVYFVWRKKH
ncbi:MAG TPA: amino acid permease [Bryobacteraceae bacterium]|nr:amino acid permease [Bryobacteraceae bacterium]